MSFFSDLSPSSTIFLLLALLLAFSFEFVNGFHDTANAVATIIYTNTLKPNRAVVLSGLMNLLGVLVSSGAVAFGIISLLPVELVVNSESGAGFAMVFALLISSIMWNLGTWFLGLPASSSHTLIGSIMGVAIANSLISEHVFGEGVNWGKAKEVMASLLVSPAVGFAGAAVLLILAKTLIGRPELYRAPEGKTPPPLWIRCLLVVTCSGVSFAHGSNDGQKGMGLVMLILIGILPGAYSLNLNTDPTSLSRLSVASQSAMVILENHSPKNESSVPLSHPQDPNSTLSTFLRRGKITQQTFPALITENQSVMDQLTGKTSLHEVAKGSLSDLRSKIYLLSKSIGKLYKLNQFTDKTERKTMLDFKKQLDSITDFIPNWVKFAVAISLGLGTTVGWKRIVTTVGEKIGKEHLSYAQGASAELVAMGTILAADQLGLPVSTTHVLSSGVAGTMAANNSGLQMQTVRNILMAWILTLPATIFLGAFTFSAGLYIALSFMH